MFTLQDKICKCYTESVVKLKKETLIIVFYVLYFSWLFAVTFLTQDPGLLNYLTVFIAFFYLIFLRGKGDIIWFATGFAISLILMVFSLEGLHVETDFEILKHTPIWLPTAWGTTIVALRKFYVTLTSVER